MGCERRAPVWQQGQGQVLLLPPLSDRYMPTGWGCGVVIAACKGGSARLHAPDGSSWSRWVRTAQGRPASRRPMWPSRCWVGSFIVRAGGRECWLAAVVVVCWFGELGRRSTTAEGLGALSRPVAWRAAARWVGCRLPLNVQRFPPSSSTECSVPDVVRPTAHPCYTCDSFFFVRLPAIECGRTGRGTRYFCNAYGKSAIKRAHL